MKFLIIDDSMVIRNIHKNLLKEKNFSEDGILEAEDGAKAIEIAQKEDIDMFLVDWNMPGINGLDFVKKIRAIPKYAETPIIMVTSEAAKYNVMEAIDSGVTNYIVKPIHGDALWNKIQKYVK
jgi:two-component system, chemotaxis family, chemotaxis protein CheY